jgi:hypothetical protein
MPTTLYTKAQNRFCFDLTPRCPTDRNGTRHQRGVRTHQRYSSGFHRDIGARTHGDANIGRGQSRRIIDAIADHADPIAGCAQFFNCAGLIGWLNCAARLVDANLAADFLDCKYCIAGQQ